MHLKTQFTKTLNIWADTTVEVVIHSNMHLHTNSINRNTISLQRLHHLVNRIGFLGLPAGCWSRIVIIVKQFAARACLSRCLEGQLYKVWNIRIPDRVLIVPITLWISTIGYSFVNNIPCDVAVPGGDHWYVIDECLSFALRAQCADPTGYLLAPYEVVAPKFHFIRISEWFDCITARKIELTLLGLDRIKFAFVFCCHEVEVLGGNSWVLTSEVRLVNCSAYE